MEAIIYNLQQVIADKFHLDNLTIDEDCGQLEALAQGLDQYPVTFPCVLISSPETSWVTHTDHQKGNVTVVVRLALDVYEDTRYGCGQEEGILERAGHAKDLNSIINGRPLSSTAAKLIRTASRSYSLPHGIKVYETEYHTSVND